MKKNLMSRRNFLITSAGATIAMLASGLRAPTLFAQGNPTATPLPLPQGAAGKLTVINKTEYFKEVQDLFREGVTK